jgi:hypothetical protein
MHFILRYTATILCCYEQSITYYLHIIDGRIIYRKTFRLHHLLLALGKLLNVYRIEVLGFDSKYLAVYCAHDRKVLILSYLGYRHILLNYLCHIIRDTKRSNR